MMTKKRRGKSNGARAALLALALSGTLSGWAILAGDALTQTPPTPVAAVVEITTAPDPLSPIPTLVPPPAGVPAIDLAQPSTLDPIPAVTQATTFRPVVRSRSSR